MMSSVLSEQRNAESRAKIIARLRGAKKAKGEKAKGEKTKGEKAKGEATSTRAKPALLKPVLPKFAEQTQGKTASFIARAEALSCQFLAEGEGKTLSKNTFAKVLRAFFEARQGKKSSKRATLPLLLFAANEKPFWEKLAILKNLEGCCRPTEVGEGVEGRDFLAAPFPAFSLQRAACAIAETGTLVFANRTRAQAVLTFLPTVHIVLLAEGDIVGSLEQAFVRTLPSSSDRALWACHCVSGPSRTADIEQTLHMGAHGPKELVILVYR